MPRVEEEEESSECSSGCQSGWTMYLDQSNETPTSLPFKKAGSIQREEEEEEEEEDLSMVSDASSGPPHFHEEDDNCYCSHSNTCNNGNECLLYTSTLPNASGTASAKNGDKRRRVEGKQQREPASLLDDTASSPLFSFPNTSFNATSNNVKPSMENVLEFSCGFSATHFKEKSALQKQMGYLHSSAPVKPTPTRLVMPLFSHSLSFLSRGQQFSRYAGMQVRRRYGDKFHSPCPEGKQMVEEYV